MSETFFTKLKKAFVVEKELKQDSFPISSSELPIPVTIKETPSGDRVSHDELELAYLTVPEIFNGINKITQNIMAAYNKVYARDKEVNTFFNEFLDQIGETGNKLGWMKLLSRIFRDLGKHGWAWVEKIYDSDYEHILDLDILDPKRMDYAKDANGNIVLDIEGNPIGYTQKISVESGTEITQKFPVPEEVYLSHDLLFVPTDRIVLFKINTFGDGFYPVGLIEPSYRKIVRKLNLEEAYTNAIYRHVLPIMHAKIGDLNHQPTPQQLDKALIKMKDLNFKKEIATPYFYELSLLQARNPENLDSSLQYFESGIINSLGIPKAFATGSGEATNRATLATQSKMWQLSLNELIHDTIETIEKQIFLPICELERFDEVPKLIWGDISLEERSDKLKRIMEYVRLGIMPINIAKEKIYEIEGFKE